MLGENLKREMAYNNITQKELARRVGITEVSMCRYVNNDRIPKAPLLSLIAKELNCTVEHLLRENDEGRKLLDVSGLSDEQIKVVKDLISLLRSYKRKGEKYH